MLNQTTLFTPHVKFTKIESLHLITQCISAKKISKEGIITSSVLVKLITFVFLPVDSWRYDLKEITEKDDSRKENYQEIMINKSPRLPRKHLSPLLPSVTQSFTLNSALRLKHGKQILKSVSQEHKINIYIYIEGQI